MPVTEVKQALGSFSISLGASTPQELLDALTYLGHVAIIEGRLNPAEYGDELLSSARYVGVYRNRVNDVDNRTHNVDGSYRLNGVGMAYWLGDENGKGPVIESTAVFTSKTFAQVIRGLLPTSVTEGTLHSVAGTYSGRHQWQTPRKAIDYVCTTFGAEWRVNGDASVDAGTIDQLYPPRTEAAMLVKHGYGRDLTLTAYQGKIDSAEDVEEYATRVVILAEGQGSSIATGAANAVSVPYKDLFGHQVALTKVVSESSTAGSNATVRAQIELDAISSTRRSLRLAASDYDVSGTLGVGEYVWVYDPDTGLYDTANEVVFRGQRINPARYRCVEMTWPIVDGMTVAFRDRDGVWWDLTDHVRFENQADVSITIGELPRSLTGGGSEPIGPRPSEDLSTPATPEWDAPFTTQSYQDALGQTRAQVLLKWLTPLNDDGSTILDGDHYEIRYAVHPATDWQLVYAAWDATSVLIQDLSPGGDYDIGIRAADRYAHFSDWSVTQTITVSADTLAPSTPAAPTVAGSLLAIQVVHELGKASGGTYNLEPDLDHFEVHVGSSSTFTPAESTLVGNLPANAGMLIAEVPAVGTFPTAATTARYVKVIAVDTSGNLSTASDAAVATADLIDDAHISNLTVSKVTAGTIGADWIVGARIKTANTGARVELNSGGIGAWTSGNVQTVAISQADGSFLLRSAATGSRLELDTTGLRIINAGGTQLVNMSTSGSFTLRSASTGARVELDTSGLRTYTSDGFQTVGLQTSDGSFFLRSSATGARVSLDTTGLKIFNGSGVTLVDLNASGSFTMRSGTSGSRIVIDQNGFEAYNAGGDRTVDINAVDGTVTVVGRISSSETAQKRLVINPGPSAGAYEPEIRLYEEYDLGQYHYWTQDLGGTHQMEIGSAIQSNRRTRMRFTSSGWEMGFCDSTPDWQGGYVTAFGAITMAYAGGSSIYLDGAGIVRIKGAWRNSSDAAFLAGKVNASGTAGTIFYGITYSGNPYPVAQVRAGTSGGFSMTNNAQDSFSFVWTGSSLSNSVDHINYFGYRAA